jgi:hypothetical protein
MLSHQPAGFFLYPIRAFVWPRRFAKPPLGRVDYVVGNARLVGGRPDVIFDHTKPGAFLGRMRTRFKYFGDLKFFVQEFLEVIGSRRPVRPQALEHTTSV